MPDQFYSLTPRQFDNMFTGFNRVKESENRAGWEQTRLQCFWIIKPYVKKSDNINEPEDLFRFHWEKKKKVEVVSNNQIEQFAERMKRFKPEKVVLDGN